MLRGPAEGCPSTFPRRPELLPASWARPCEARRYLLPRDGDSRGRFLRCGLFNGRLSGRGFFRRRGSGSGWAAVSTLFLTLDRVLHAFNQLAGPVGKHTCRTLKLKPRPLENDFPFLPFFENFENGSKHGCDGSAATGRERLGRVGKIQCRLPKMSEGAQLSETRTTLAKRHGGVGRKGRTHLLYKGFGARFSRGRSSSLNSISNSICDLKLRPKLADIFYRRR